MKLIVYILLVNLLVGCSAGKLSAQKGKPKVFALSTKALQEHKEEIRNNTALQPAYKKLLKDADKALDFGPVSVMEKKNDPPSGDKHDYMSLAPYHWPDPAKADGLPYIRKDGQTTPEVKEYKDKEYMPKVCNNVQLLGLAYYYSGEEKYATHAAKLLRVWFLDEATKMNPNLKYGQAIKGVNEGRGAGMIDSRHFVVMIDGINLISNSKAWTKDDQQKMKQWCSEFLHWMQTSKVGMDEMKAKNNHGAFYDAQRLSLALYIDSAELAKKIIANAASRLDKQMNAEGFFPLELERTISLHYSSFVLEAFFKIAQMSEQVGVDFWTMKTASGHSLQEAFAAIKPYLADPASWKKGEQIKPYDTEDAYPILLMGARHYQCKDCVSIVQKIAGEKGPALRDFLMY